MDQWCQWKWDAHLSPPPFCDINYIPQLSLKGGCNLLDIPFPQSEKPPRMAGKSCGDKGREKMFSRSIHAFKMNFLKSNMKKCFPFENWYYHANLGMTKHLSSSCIHEYT